MKTSAIMVYAHPAMKFTCTALIIPPGGYYEGVSIDAASVLQGSRFLNGKFYWEMAFEVFDTIKSDIVSVQVLNFPATPVPSKAIVSFVLPPNTITFDNQSGENALIRLIGPTRNTFMVSDGTSETLHASPGRYDVKLRYGDDPQQYAYFRGEPFDVKQESSSYSKTTITLHKVPGGKYRTMPIQSDEFEKD
jgi:hypothetical protein